jgi:hypothetical protein
MCLVVGIKVCASFSVSHLAMRCTQLRSSLKLSSSMVIRASCELDLLALVAICSAQHQVLIGLLTQASSFLFLGHILSYKVDKQNGIERLA